MQKRKCCICGDTFHANLYYILDHSSPIEELKRVLSEEV